MVQSGAATKFVPILTSMKPHTLWTINESSFQLFLSLSNPIHLSRFWKEIWSNYFSRICLLLRTILAWTISLCQAWFLTFCLINCSQTQFAAIILALLVFFNAIFCLTDFLSDPFDFSSSKAGWTGSAQRALKALRALQISKYAISINCLEDLYLWCEGRPPRRGWPPPHSPPSLTSPPPNPHPCTSFRP